jgi:hypothetical protein
MRRFTVVFVFSFLVFAAVARAEPQWLTLPPTPSLPAPVKSGYATVNGIKIWYAEFGRGTSVILLHGGLANSNYWGKLVPALAPHYRVIIMDSRGHGRSWKRNHIGPRTILQGPTPALVPCRIHSRFLGAIAANTRQTRPCRIRSIRGPIG